MQPPDDAPPVQVYDAVKTAFATLAGAFYRGGEPREGAIPTGKVGFDRALGGFVPGEIVALTGPVGSGRTRMACELALGVMESGTSEDGPRAGVLFATNHARAEDVALRLVCAHADLSFSTLRAGQLTSEAQSHYFEAASHVAALPLWVDVRPCDTAATVLQRVEDHAAQFRECRMRLLIVDDWTFGCRAIGDLRAVCQRTESAALLVLRDARQGSIADAHIALRRAKGRLRPVLLHAREALARPLAWDWRAV